jgi:hypothetical protein
MALTDFDSSPTRILRLQCLTAMKRLAGTAVALFALVACEPEATRKEDWGRHDAYQFCNAAIRHYPDKPAPPCEAISMCANEGALSDAERKKLDDMIAKEKCPEP